MRNTIMVCLLAAAVMALALPARAQGNGSVDWTTRQVTGTGLGTPPPNAVNAAQGRAMAERAAIVIARRNLLEILKGVQIDSSTTVENFMVTNDTVAAKVSGFLQNSQAVDVKYHADGSVEVTVAVLLQGELAETLTPPTIPFKRERTEPAPDLTPDPTPDLAPDTTPEPDPLPELDTEDLTIIPPAAGAYTGLVLDARGLDVKPAMSPKVFDEDGNEVYGSAQVSREYAIQQGMAGYAKDLDRARENDRVGSRPLVIKALKVEGESGTDLVIANKDARTLQASASSGMLEQCRVMIVLE